jgi:hypothetical protein
MKHILRDFPSIIQIFRNWTHGIKYEDVWNTLQ